jgi:hypothetical protein
MRKAMIIYYKINPLVVIILSTPLQNTTKILDKFAKKYEYYRENLSFIVVDVLEDPELLVLD